MRWALQGKELQNHLQEMLSHFAVRIALGKTSVVVRQEGVTKGAIVDHIIKHYNSRGGADFVLCLGDDTADEDMFKVISAYHRDAQYRIVANSQTVQVVDTRAPSARSPDTRVSAPATPAPAAPPPPTSAFSRFSPRPHRADAALHRCRRSRSSRAPSGASRRLRHSAFTSQRRCRALPQTPDPEASSASPPGAAASAHTALLSVLASRLSTQIPNRNGSFHIL
jgi:hypothetical protein